MSDIEEAKLLLSLAEEDLHAAEIMAGTPGVAERIFGFHAQQAVEKGLKAWLAVLGAEYPYTHSLNLLFSVLQDNVGATVDPFRSLETLTPFAVQFRYEAYEDDEEELDREQVINAVGALLDQVKRLVAG